MKKITRLVLTASAAAALAACQMMPSGSNPSDSIDAGPGGWPQSSGNVIHGGFGTCWTTSYSPVEREENNCPPVYTPPLPTITPPPPAVTPPPPPPPKKVTFKADVMFDFDKAVLKPEGRSALDSFLSGLQDVMLDVFVVVGHTDSIAPKNPPDYNEKLSVRRAEAVKDYLVSKGGMPDTRVFTDGKGAKEPIADNRTREGRAQNRRVVIEVMGIKHHD